VGSINSFKGRLDKIRRTRMGFLLILYDPQSPRPHGDRTPVRPHKVSHKVSQNCSHKFNVFRWDSLFLAIVCEPNKKKTPDS